MRQGLADQVLVVDQHDRDRASNGPLLSYHVDSLSPGSAIGFNLPDFAITKPAAPPSASGSSGPLLVRSGHHSGFELAMYRSVGAE